ncbi:MAG: hypothetical protein HC849_17050 [Oscillatoriales cyanobacterium RU_3_3]|nr:hypothetical protein [Oscillatoriales cyanobacterium RU_3_3]NJR22681.1 hypothetical protein [Richelia sp. CSU_2_1]
MWAERSGGNRCINLDLVYQCCWLDRQLGRYLRLLLKKRFPATQVDRSRHRFDRF